MKLNGKLNCGWYWSMGPSPPLTPHTDGCLILFVILWKQDSHAAHCMCIYMYHRMMTQPVIRILRILTIINSMVINIIIRSHFGSSHLGTEPCCPGQFNSLLLSTPYACQLELLGTDWDSLGTRLELLESRLELAWDCLKLARNSLGTAWNC